MIAEQYKASNKKIDSMTTKQIFDKFIESSEIVKARMNIKCPYCKYNGGDPKIGTQPLSDKMMCSKCKRYFHPFANQDGGEK